MNAIPLNRAAVVLVALLTSCGGSDSDPRQDAVDRANRKESEARTLGVATPCADVSQCGALVFVNPSDACASETYKSYSLVSSTATAASAAAQEQNDLAKQALALAASSAQCPVAVSTPPTLTCTANACGP